MILTLISKKENPTYNLIIAKKLGVLSAIYLSILIDNITKETNSVKFTRKEIYNLTGIENNKQKEIEDKLSSCGIVEITQHGQTSANIYTLSETAIISLLLNESNDFNNLFNLMKKIKPKALNTPKNVEELKKSIKTKDVIAKKYLETWIDTVLNKSEYLLPQTVNKIERELCDYAKDSLDKYRELCKLASELGYVTSRWIVNKYEQKQNLKLNDLTQEEIDKNIQEIKKKSTEVF